MIQTESSYQNLEPLPDIIDICQPTEPKPSRITSRNLTPNISRVESRNLSPNISRVESRNLSPNIRNQRSKSYANALKLQPYEDQEQENKNLITESEESVLQLSKIKLMSKEFDMGLTLAGISLMFVLCQSVKLYQVFMN